MNLKCLFGHGHTLRERDEAGTLQLVCERCGAAVPVLPGQTFVARKVKKARRPKLTLARKKAVGEVVPHDFRQSER